MHPSDTPSRPVRRRLLAGAGALGAAALAGCALPMADAPARPPAPAPRLRVGDQWRYELVNRYNGLRLGEVTMRVSALAPQLRIAVAGAGAPEAGTEEVYAEPWRMLQEPGYDLVQVYETPQPLLPARLEAGASERWLGRYRIAGSDEWLYWSVWAGAVRWEEVNVPAGRFEALRVERRIAFKHSDLWREQSERLDTLWYAPQVNRWVQREWTGTYRRYGIPRFVGQREDWVISRLVEYRPAAG
jgi:hypothetical protein